MQVLILLILLYGVSSLDAEVVNICAPAEENTTYSFIIYWFPPLFEKTDLAIMKGEMVMATCDTDLKCQDQFEHITLTTVTGTTNGMLLTNLTIFNVTRREQALWSTRHVKGTRLLKSTEMSCYLQTFVKPQDVQCSSQLDVDYLDIICSTREVYPKGKCQFAIKSPGLTLKPAKTIEYTHNTSDNGRVPYIQSTCRLRINQTQLPTDDFSISVSMYPDLKNEFYDMSHGSTYFLLYTRDSVSSCQEKISNGQIVLCSVKTMQVAASAAADSSAVVDPDSTEVELTTTVTTVTKYNPAEAVDGKCSIDTLNELVSIQCAINHHMFQQIKCQLQIQNQEDVLFIEEITPFKTIYIETYNKNIYQSHCSFELLMTNLPRIDSTLVVTIIADDDTRNTLKNISLQLEPTSQMLAESNSPERNRLQVLVIGLLIGFVIVASLVLLVYIARKKYGHCFKKNEEVFSQEEDHNLYAEIIEGATDLTRTPSGPRPHYINSHFV